MNKRFVRQNVFFNARLILPPCIVKLKMYSILLSDLESRKFMVHVEKAKGAKTLLKFLLNENVR